jgi:hypothetical protein
MSASDPHLDHVQELFPLILSQLLVLFHAFDIQLVLGLGPGRLKRTRQDGQLGVLDRRRHLRVRHVLVDDDTLDERRVFQRTSDLAVDLDQLEIDVPTFEVGHRQDGVDSDLSELFVSDRDAVRIGKVGLAWIPSSIIQRTMCLTSCFPNWSSRSSTSFPCCLLRTRSTNHTPARQSDGLNPAGFGRTAAYRVCYPV